MWVFKIKSGHRNCNSKKVLYLLRCKIFMMLPKLEKLKQSSVISFRFDNYKTKHRSFRKGKQNVPQKRFHSHYVQDCHRAIDDWEVTLFKKSETHHKLKERETF